jgi:quercetin dioxygenase-like cupin family protein
MKQQTRNFGKPDQTLAMELGRVDIIGINGGMVGLATFEPGWKWSLHEKPVIEGAGDFCAVPHFVYLVRGQLHIVQRDGSEYDLKSGDVATIPADHDGWVVGDQTAVMFDFSGAAGTP